MHDKAKAEETDEIDEVEIMRRKFGGTTVVDTPNPTQDQDTQDQGSGHNEMEEGAETMRQQPESLKKEGFQDPEKEGGDPQSVAAASPEGGESKRSGREGFQDGEMEEANPSLVAATSPEGGESKRSGRNGFQAPEMEEAEPLSVAATSPEGGKSDRSGRNGFQNQEMEEANPQSVAATSPEGGKSNRSGREGFQDIEMKEANPLSVAATAPEGGKSNRSGRERFQDPEMEEANSSLVAATSQEGSEIMGPGIQEYRSDAFRGNPQDVATTADQGNKVLSHTSTPGSLHSGSIFRGEPMSSTRSQEMKGNHANDGLPVLVPPSQESEDYIPPQSGAYAAAEDQAQGVMNQPFKEMKANEPSTGHCTPKGTVPNNPQVAPSPMEASAYPQGTFSIF